WVVCGRGTQSILRARGRWLAWSSGPSTSPLAAMKPSRRSILWLVATVVVALAVFELLPNWHWYGNERQVQSYLIKTTPLGSSEDDVIAYLRRSGARSDKPWRGQVTAGGPRAYPPNTVAGSSFIRAVVNYRLVFATSVEAFYIFDANRRLVEIAVRETTDA